MPSTSVMPCAGKPVIDTPETAEPEMKGARSMVPEPLTGTVRVAAAALGFNVPTVTLILPGCERPVPLTAMTAKLSAPE